MNLLTNIIKTNIIKETNNYYVLKFNTNDDIKYILSIQKNNIFLILTIKHEIFLNDIEYYKYENSINYIINNKIATYYKIVDANHYGFYKFNVSIYFTNINPEILLRVI